jgi:golgi SNAP receptor complex member 1
MWEQLKKNARKLEGELEVKLMHFSRLCTGLDASTPNDSLRSHQAAKQIAVEITSLLRRLEDLHNSMESDISGSEIRQHTVARHRDIMLDYSQEFRRLNSQLNQVHAPPQPLQYCIISTASMLCFGVWCLESLY